MHTSIGLILISAIAFEQVSSCYLPFTNLNTGNNAAAIANLQGIANTLQSQLNATTDPTVRANLQNAINQINAQIAALGGTSGLNTGLLPNPATNTGTVPVLNTLAQRLFNNRRFAGGLNSIQGQQSGLAPLVPLTGTDAAGISGAEPATNLASSFLQPSSPLNSANSGLTGQTLQDRLKAALERMRQLKR